MQLFIIDDLKPALTEASKLKMSFKVYEIRSYLSLHFFIHQGINSHPLIFNKFFSPENQRNMVTPLLLARQVLQ